MYKTKVRTVTLTYYDPRVEDDVTKTFNLKQIDPAFAECLRFLAKETDPSGRCVDLLGNIEMGIIQPQ